MSKLAAIAAALQTNKQNNLPKDQKTAFEALEQIVNNMGGAQAATTNPPSPPSYYNGTTRKSAMQRMMQMIKTERYRQGLTQRQLATKSGYSQGTITRAERTGWISYTCLLAIIDALGKEITLTNQK